MLITLASALLATSAPVTTAPAVNVGRFDPEAFPEARMRERRLPIEHILVRVEDILRERRCTFPGQNYRRFDIRVPYVVKLEPDGTPTEVVVTDLGCAPLEFYVGSIIRELARAGDFRPTGASEAAWYVSELRFTVH